MATTNGRKQLRTKHSRTESTSDKVLRHLRDLVQQGKLKAGDRLPGERDLAERLEVSRPTLRAALTSLATIGILESRHGSGTYVTGIDKPAVLDPSPLKLMAALRGFSTDEMFEARLALEMATVGLAARHANSEQMAVLAEELAGIFSAVNSPDDFLAHDLLFHRGIAEASHNRILAAITEMVIAAMFGPRTEAVKWAPDLKEAAEWHHRIYRAIREHNPEAAEEAMRDHLSRAHAVWKSGKNGSKAAGKAGSS